MAGLQADSPAVTCCAGFLEIHADLNIKGPLCAF